MTGFSSPNYTQAPNDLFDTLMKDMSEAELKVVMVAIRKTFGYHKNQDAISFTQFQDMTGLSRQSVADGIDAAIKRGVLKIAGHGKRGVNIYSLVVILDQSENQTSTSQENGLDASLTSQKSRHTKEKDVKRKSETTKRTPKDNAPKDALIDAWCTAVGVDVDKMGATMTDGTRRKIAEKMLGWKTPPTPEEIRKVVALKRRKGVDYEFRYLLDDIPMVRAHNHLQENGGVEGRRGVRLEDSISYYLPPAEAVE